MKTPGTRITRRLGDDDLPLLMRFLNAHRESSLILLSNARRAGLVDRGKPFQGLYVASQLDGKITGVAAHYWNGMLALQAPDDAAALARYVRAGSDRSLNGIIGPSDQVRAATVIDAVPPVFDSAEILYSLTLADLVIPPEHSKLAGVRRATLADLDTLAHWSADYNVELLGAAASESMLDTCRKSVRRLIEGGHQWVLSDALPDAEPNFRTDSGANSGAGSGTGAHEPPGNGRLLAACTFNAGVDDCVQIGGVWTPVGMRQRGHARTVVAGALLTARREGISQAILFTGEQNRFARRAYHALGFTPIGTYHIRLYRHPA